MKYFFASDIHGSAYFCGQMLDCYEKESADRLVLLGDILYHGPRNDLPGGYTPKEVITMLNSHKDEIIAVRGNCDSEVDQMVLEFPLMADYGVIDLGDRSIYLTHGHRYNQDNLPPIKPGDILMCGHTHVPGYVRHEDYIYMNPGSVSIPKENSHRGYIILESGIFTWKDFEGEEKLKLTLD